MKEYYVIKEKNCIQCYKRWKIEEAPNFCPDCGCRTTNIRTYYIPKLKKNKKIINWKVGDLAYIPNAVYDYFRKPSKITKIEGEYAWLDVPDDNPVKLESLKKVVKYNEKEMS